MLQLVNIYNSYSLFIIFTKESFTISWLKELIKNDCKQLIIKDFNMHHSHWEDRRYFTHHMMIDALLNIIMNARLKLLFKSDIIIRKIHNQLIMINLTFNSKKIQFMIYKCKMRTDLHQEFNHFSIAIKLCLCTFFIQLSTRWLWKKMNTETLNIYLRIYLFVDHFFDNRMMINDRVIEITCILQEIIKKSTLWAKSSNWTHDFWNQICSEIMIKSWWLWIIWKTQSTLRTWNDYLKYNDHKNKIIKEMKHSHFRSQMHALTHLIECLIT